MLRENLGKANEINAKIRNLEVDRNIWAGATYLTGINVYNDGSKNTDRTPVLEFLPFDTIKTLVLANLDKAISELTEQIEQLS